MFLLKVNFITTLESEKQHPLKLYSTNKLIFEE